MSLNTLAFFKRFKKQIKDDMLIKSVFKDNGELFFEIEHSPYNKEQNVIFALSYPYFDNLDLFISAFDEIRHRKRIAIGDKFTSDLQRYTIIGEITIHELIHKFQEVIGVKDEE